MADLAASDVTYTVVHQRIGENGRKNNVIKLTFGDSSLTYPAAGVPLTKAKLGCPNVVEALNVFSKGTSGYEWSYNYATEKLVAIQDASKVVSAHTHSLILNDGAATDGTDTRVLAAAGGTDLGGSFGSDLTIAGVSAATGAGGILIAAAQTVAAAAGAEPSAVAIAAQTIYVEVTGW